MPTIRRAGDGHGFASAWQFRQHLARGQIHQRHGIRRVIGGQSVLAAWHKRYIHRAAMALGRRIAPKTQCEHTKRSYAKKDKKESVHDLTPLVPGSPEERQRGSKVIARCAPPSAQRLAKRATTHRETT